MIYINFCHILWFISLYVKVIKSVGNTVFSLNELDVRRHVAGSNRNKPAESSNGSKLQQAIKFVSPKSRANAGMKKFFFKFKYNIVEE